LAGEISRLNVPRRLLAGDLLEVAPSVVRGIP
jgi:hypothetical protein